jgi:nitroreductase
LVLVKAAILAANPHNTQPWLFKVSESRIEIFSDSRRNLGTMDVYMREMHIGLGCAIENMLLAAQANGYEADVQPSSGTLTDINMSAEPMLAATLNLSPGKASVSGLYKAIPNRHTDRAAYDKTRPLSNIDLDTLTALADKESDVNISLFSSEEKVKLFTEGSIKATQDIIDDATMAHDSAKWFRHSWQDVQKYKDGPYIDTAGVSPLMRAMVKILPPVSEKTENGYWLDATKTTLTSTPVTGFITVRDLYDRPQALSAGQVWQRMHLWATTKGLSMQPVNQMMEVVDRERDLNKKAHTREFLADMIDDSNWKPTFAFRVGYPTLDLLASPRRPVEEVLL